VPVLTSCIQEELDRKQFVIEVETVLSRSIDHSFSSNRVNDVVTELRANSQPEFDIESTIQNTVSTPGDRFSNRQMIPQEIESINCNRNS
jgi:hypothetical protein